jgi:hypothetical protein
MAARGIGFPFGLMVIDDLDVQRTGAKPRPLKANPPLGVYPDAVLPIPVAFERFNAVAWERSEIRKGSSSVEDLQPFVGLSSTSLKFPDARLTLYVNRNYGVCHWGHNG